MKRIEFWVAIMITVMMIAFLVVWTQNQSSRPWSVILIWAGVIIVLQLMFIYLIVFKNRK